MGVGNADSKFPSLRTRSAISAHLLLGIAKETRWNLPLLAGEVGPDMTFAWKMERNIDVRAGDYPGSSDTQSSFYDADEQSGSRSLLKKVGR